MVDFNKVKLKDLLEMKFGADFAQQIISAVQTSIDNNQTKAELRNNLWQNVIKPKLADTDIDLGETLAMVRVLEVGVFIPSPPDLNI